MPPFVARRGTGVPALPDQPHRRPAGRRRSPDRDHGAGGNAGRRDGPVGHARSIRPWPATPPSNGPSTVEDDACLVVLPGPAIPFRGSRYYQRGRVELAPRAGLIWGDIWLPGRYDRGVLSERFQFERIVQDFEVRRDGRLVYRDRFRWDGPWTPEDADWYFGGALASASLFVAGPDARVPAGGRPSLRRSVFRLDTGDTCVRWCGPPAAVTADLVHTALRVAAGWTVGPEAPPWLLASSGLAPNHWFSTAGRTKCEWQVEMSRARRPIADSMMEGRTMGLLGILLALALLMWLAFRGWSVLLVAPAAALLAAAMSGEPLLAHWTQTFMGSASRFVGAMASLVPARRVVRQAHG